MPSIKTITPIFGGSYYHIFNRGINRQNIFFAERNYLYFFELLKKYLSAYIDILAYCLLPNHFHLIIRVKDALILPANDPIFLKDRIIETITDETEIGRLVSDQFRRLFISYTMAVNKQENRSGALFESKFKRLEIEDDNYLKYAIFYTHLNPEKHGIGLNFRKYNYSSYQSVLSSKPTKINRDLVLELFDGQEEFISYHKFLRDEKEAVIGIRSLREIGSLGKIQINRYGKHL